VISDYHRHVKAHPDLMLNDCILLIWEPVRVLLNKKAGSKVKPFEKVWFRTNLQRLILHLFYRRFLVKFHFPDNDSYTLLQLKSIPWRHLLRIHDAQLVDGLHNVHSGLRTALLIYSGHWTAREGRGAGSSWGSKTVRTAICSRRSGSNSANVSLINF
jgi:hypothetical protein